MSTLNSNKLTYAGIGARSTPADVLAQMTSAAQYLASHSCVLRSGGANGADSAFETGVVNSNLKEIYLPWRGFNNNRSHLHNVCSGAMRIAESFHPNWSALSQGARKLMGRNTYQMLGPTLDNPSDFILCWTPNGNIVGGTGQAIRMAQEYDIPVFNMGGQSLDYIHKSVDKIIGL